MIDDMELSSSDQELMTEINAAIVRYIQSDDAHLQMDPMNSYRRRMVHKIATEYKLNSESTGEGEDRSVRLSKTATTTIPENINKQRVVDRGIEIFYAKPGAEIVLRTDGSFGVSLKEGDNKILDKRTVDEGEFRIRDNKIICKQDSNW
ncbi:MAG: hypothetical protein HN351_07605 [Deltaproteobacteria bacterium]|jgi:hypothetical protein|nr:hypothetical protein [Deltaproteobacteria bacterium]